MPPVRLVIDRVDESPWLIVVAETEPVGVLKARFTVTEGAFDWEETAPKLSVTVTVIVGEPAEVGV